MMMLTGIKAFEARWQSLREIHPTNATENHLLMQSMGRLVDNYATQEEIVRDLPAALQSLFNRLVDAYLNGYWLEEAEAPAAKPALSPAALAAKQRRQKNQPPLQPTEASEAATYIIRDRAACLVRAAI